jgi:hypothetical protein
VEKLSRKAWRGGASPAVSSIVASGSDAGNEFADNEKTRGVLLSLNGSDAMGTSSETFVFNYLGYLWHGPICGHNGALTTFGDGAIQGYKNGARWTGQLAQRCVSSIRNS